MTVKKTSKEDQLKRQKELEEKAKQVERKFKGEEEIYHDLFKLDLAMCQKNVSYQEGVINLVPVEHSHFFHTVNSQGKEQTHCVATAGHTHRVKVNYDEEGNIASVECGPPVFRKKGRDVPMPKYRSSYDSEPVPIDTHTHDVKYIRSEKIKNEA